MHERPIGDLVDALRQLGCPVDCLGKEGYPPLRLGDGATHALKLNAAHPRARRRVQPVPDSPVDGAAPGGHGRTS